MNESDLVFQACISSFVVLFYKLRFIRILNKHFPQPSQSAPLCLLRNHRKKSVYIGLWTPPVHAQRLQPFTASERKKVFMSVGQNSLLPVQPIIVFDDTKEAKVGV